MTEPTKSQSIAALEHITVRAVEQLTETRTKLAEVEAEQDQHAAAIERTIRLLDNNEPIHPATLAAALTGNYCDCGGPHQPTECGGDTEPFLPDPAAVRAALGSLLDQATPTPCTCDGDGIHQIGCPTN